jgi:biopolymer transport protein ExbD
MKLRHKKQTATNDDNLIPLINVVFLMLIFFLAAGALRPFSEEGVKPATANETGNDERPSGPVLINAKGQVTIKGVEYEFSSLAGLFRHRVTSGQTTPLPIVADRGLTASKLVDVIEAAKAAGIKKIRLVTRRKKAQ